MPGGWVFTILCLVVFAVAAMAIVGGMLLQNTEAAALAGVVAAVAAVLSIISWIASSYDRVDTRNVGIVTYFGKPVSIRQAGLAWHKPWERLSELPESIQLQAFESTSYREADQGASTNNPGVVGPAVKVRYANNSNGYVNENLQWRLKEGAATKVFSDYGGTKNDVFKVVKEQLVDRQAQVQVSRVFAKFNPQLPGQGAQLPELAKEVMRDLQDAVGDEIEVLDVKIPTYFVDDETQKRIDGNNTRVQDTMNAEQDVKTAEQKALAAQKLGEGPPPNLQAAQVQCVLEAVNQHRPADAAGCFGQIGGNGVMLQMQPPR